MPNLNIQVIGTAEEWIDKGQGKGYNKLTVTYKLLNGPNGKTPIEAKSIMDFAQPEVYDRLKKAKQNELYTITSEKVNGYWTWTEVHRSDDAPPADTGTPTTVSVGGNFVQGSGKVNTYEEKNKLDRERYEFDKQKQDLIIRQSCLSSAVALVEKPAGVELVLKIAAQFEAWVHGKTMSQITDDIPQ